MTNHNFFYRKNNAKRKFINGRIITQVNSVKKILRNEKRTMVNATFYRSCNP